MDRKKSKQSFFEFCTSIFHWLHSSPEIFSLCRKFRLQGRREIPTKLTLSQKRISVIEFGFFLSCMQNLSRCSSYSALRTDSESSSNIRVTFYKESHSWFFDNIHKITTNHDSANSSEMQSTSSPICRNSISSSQC